MKRIETDSMGQIEVDDDKYYGAQTQRSLENFKIGNEKMPKEIILSLVYIKKTAAIVNKNLNEITNDIADKIIDACDEIIANFDNFYQNQFPLVVWQTGSGTQTNMNVNEVIAGLANEKATSKKGGKSPVHPNDHVNCGQSSNDTFPTAMHVSSVLLVYQKMLPTLIKFYQALYNKEKQFSTIIKIGRTHTQDATPITLGQEFSGYKMQILYAISAISDAITPLLFLAQGGTAVGTGLNCNKKFAALFADEMTTILNLPDLMQSVKKSMQEIDQNHSYATNTAFEQFFTSDNKFFSLACCDSLVNFHGSLKSLAVGVMKIANDIRFLASGPRSGLGELILPENEPGSSIMPGKVNPTQCEALTMIACQVMGNDVAISIGGSNGHFELNVFRPMIIRNIVHSINLLNDGINSFIDNCLIDLKPNTERIKQLLEQSLMLVTSLNPHIGYDNAAKIAKKAHKENKTLKQAGIELELLTAEQYDKWVVTSEMV